MARKEKLGFRIYNFGGNPMMVKIPDRSVDVVFDVFGQEPHDVVPGAYIATQAGAVLTDLDGKTIDLGEVLLKPREKIRYVLAATDSLAAQLRSLLRKKT